MCLAGIRCENAGTARIGEDGDAIAARHRLVSEERGDSKHFLEPLGADDAGLPEQGLDDGFA